MAGRGPAPKDPKHRARHSKSDQNLTVIEVEPVEQPKLPTFYVTNDDGKKTRFQWPVVTRHWWKMWAESPLSTEFIESDWSFLADTAVLHAKFWTGDMRVGSELRLRVSKFGATPEDRARLRIQFAQADEADAKRGSRKPSASRRRGLKLVD